MAGEIKCSDTSGRTVYAVIFVGGTTWTGLNTFGIITQANMNTHTVALTEQDASGIYVGNFPTAITSANRYSILLFEQTGGSPSVAADIKLSSAPAINWLGSSASTGSTLDFTQVIPTTNTAQTVGDALNAARALGFGNLNFNPATKQLTLYAPDGVTVIHTFTANSSTNPTSRS